MGCWSSFWNTGPVVTWDPYKFTDSHSQCAHFSTLTVVIAGGDTLRLRGKQSFSACRVSIPHIQTHRNRTNQVRSLHSSRFKDDRYSVTVNTQMSWHGLVKFGGEIESRRRIHIGCYLPVASQPNSYRQCIYSTVKSKPVCNITRKMAAVVYCNLKSRRFQATLRTPTENPSLNLNV